MGSINYRGQGDRKGHPYNTRIWLLNLDSSL